MNNKKAFTLTETVIAVAIMGLIIITVLGVFVTGNNAIKKGRSVIVATNIAEKKLSEIKNLFAKYPDGNVSLSDISSTISFTDGTTPAIPLVIWSNGLNYQISGKEHVDRADYDFVIELSDFNGIKDLKEIKVRIDWTDPISGAGRFLEMKTLLARE